MSKPSNLHLNDDAIQDELVAYLDGELDDSSVHRVEQRLAQDDQYRGRMQELEKAWRLLDHLPQSPVEDSFTKSTVEMITVVAKQEVKEKSKTRGRLFLWGTGVSFVVVAAVGFILVEQLFPDPNDQLIEDLPVVEKIDEYRYLDDIDFLRKLEESGLFSEEVEDEFQ